MKPATRVRCSQTIYAIRRHLDVSAAQERDERPRRRQGRRFRKGGR